MSRRYAGRSLPGGSSFAPGSPAAGGLTVALKLLHRFLGVTGRGAAKLPPAKQLRAALIPQSDRPRSRQVAPCKAAMCRTDSSCYVAADSVFTVSSRPFALGKGSHSPKCPFLLCPALPRPSSGQEGVGYKVAAFGAGTLAPGLRHRWTRRVRGALPGDPASGRRENGPTTPERRRCGASGCCAARVGSFCPGLQAPGAAPSSGPGSLARAPERGLIRRVQGTPPQLRDPASGVHLGVEGGILCQLLRSPDYNLFPKSAVFESNFIQVTKQGNWVDIHNAPTLVTLGVTSSEPCLPLPNVLLIARLAVLGESPPRRVDQLQEPSMALSRLLPLRYVRLSVQDSSRRLLRVQVVTGKVYYLRLHQAHPDAVFKLWSRLADILQRGLSITTKDPTIHVPHSLVLSVGSSSTSSPAQLVPDSQPPSGASRSVVARMGKRLSGTLSHLSGAALGKTEKDSSVQRRHPTPDLIQDRTSRRHVTLLEASGPYHTPSQKEAVEVSPPSGLERPRKLAVCGRCRRDRPSDTGEKASLRTALRWLDTKCHGLWERDTPAGLLPLSRLSSLVAAGRH
nr:protein FAM71F1-like [Chelonoidis abingdonii]